jgi:hypothetical protein
VYFDIYAGMSKPKMIESPNKMWDLFTEYKKKTKSNPILKHDFVGGMAKEVRRQIERPLTMEGFENYVADQGLNEELSYYFANRDNKYQDYLPICARIRREIREDQIGGGLAGIYNPSITQRLNNLVEKIQEDGSKEITIKVIRGTSDKA